MNGQVDSEKLEEALEQATDGAVAEESPMEEAEEGEEMAMAEEEDPLAVARRKFFKPEKKPERSPGTAIMIAMQAKKPTMGKKSDKGYKA
jgi:hypothetical protein